MMTLAPRSSVASLVSLALLLSAASASAQLELPGAKGPKGPKPLAEFRLPDWGTSAAFSRDGKWIAIGTYGKVLVIDAAAKTVAREIKVKSGFVRGVAWMPDHQTLVTGCFQAVEFWNSADGKNVRSLKVKGYANDVKTSPDGMLVAAATETGDVRLWKAADGSEQSTLATGKDPLFAVAFSTDGTKLAAAGGDDTRLSRPGVVKVWNVADGTEARVLDVVPEKCATDVSFSPDGSVLYVADMNERVTLFDLSTGIARGFFGKHTRPVNSVVPMRDGLRVISGSGGRFQDGNVVKFWTVADGKDFATLEHHAGKVARIALSPDESQLVTVSFDKTAAVWDVAEVSKPAATAAVGSEAPRLESAGTGGLRRAAFGPEFVAADFPNPGTFKRIGIIGLDTSHATAFTKEFNAMQFPDPKKVNSVKEPTFIEQATELKGFRVTAAYPRGSADIKGSVSRVPEYTATVQKHQVKIVGSIPELLKEVDYVLLETNDGRPHLEQVLPVLAAGKPVFVDKPIAASLADAIAIFEAAGHYKTPVFSSSSLRYTIGAAAVRAGKYGEILGADASSPCSIEPTHPDFYWYGIHGVEILFTAMGTGCESVTRSSTANTEVAVGTWPNGRTGTYRGDRSGKGPYALTVTTKEGDNAIDLFAKSQQPKGANQSLYFPLLAEISQFFRTGKTPVSEAETLEIYAFMSAADESKKLNGAAVTLESVMSKARVEAKKSLEGKLK